MERRAAAESSEARLRAGQMMHADLEADAAAAPAPVTAASAPPPAIVAGGARDGDGPPTSPLTTADSTDAVAAAVCGESHAVLDAYFSMDTNLPDVDTDPLDFYRNAGKPGQATCIEEQLLRPLVRKYLAAPGANHRIERHWSSTRHYLDYTKSGIAPATVDDCMVLHYNSESLGLWPPKPVPF